MWNTEAWKSFTGNNPRSRSLGVRQYHPIGFAKSRIPEALWARINDFYLSNRDQPEKWLPEGEESLYAPGGHLTVVDDGYESKLELARTTLVMNPGSDLEQKIIEVNFFF